MKQCASLQEKIEAFIFHQNTIEPEFVYEQRKCYEVSFHLEF